MSTPSTRPVTASGASHAYHDAEGDLYIKYKKLQKQLEFLQVLHIVTSQIQHKLLSLNCISICSLRTLPTAGSHLHVMSEQGGARGVQMSEMFR